MMLRLKKMSWLFVTLLFLLSSNAQPAVYWATAARVPVQQGVRTKVISVCFVGDAVTSRPDRVQQILDYINEFEYAANIRFDFLGTCPPSTPQLDGTDDYDGDIRIVLRNIPGTKVASWPGEEGTGPVPGNGCPMFRDASGKYNGKNDGWGSWSNAPWDLSPNRACLYNMKLGDDPWPPGGGMAVGDPPSAVPYLNHTLHEFGHALGLAHEHQRTDVDVAICSAPGYGDGITSGFLTPYDRNSVMNYQFLSCGINGNYDNTGLSGWDRLALHILYPEDDRVAEFVGTTVMRTTDTVWLQSTWKAGGANMSFVTSYFAWALRAEGVPSFTTVSTTPDLNVNLTEPGDYELEFTYRDFLGRDYFYRGPIRVLDPATYNEQIAAPVAARWPLLN